MMSLSKVNVTIVSILQTPVKDQGYDIIFDEVTHLKGTWFNLPQVLWIMLGILCH